MLLISIVLPEFWDGCITGNLLISQNFRKDQTSMHGDCKMMQSRNPNKLNCKIDWILVLVNSGQFILRRSLIKSSPYVAKIEAKIET